MKILRWIAIIGLVVIGCDVWGMENIKEKEDFFVQGYKKSDFEEEESDPYTLEEIDKKLVLACNVVKGHSMRSVAISQDTSGSIEQKRTVDDLFSEDYYEYLCNSLEIKFADSIPLWDNFNSSDNFKNYNEAAQRLDQLRALLHTFIITLKSKSRWLNAQPSQKDILAADYFDRLIQFQLRCAQELKEYPKSQEIITNFESLKVSKYNPLYWGNWYDQLHRSIIQMPPLPWKEPVNKIKDPQEISKGEGQCSRVINYLNDMQKNENEVLYQRGILMLYLLAIRELRIIIHDFSTWGAFWTKWSLRALGAGVLGLGITGAYLYLNRGKRAGGPASQNHPAKVSPMTKPLGNLSEFAKTGAYRGHLGQGVGASIK